MDVKQPLPFKPTESQKLPPLSNLDLPRNREKLQFPKNLLTQPDVTFELLHSLFSASIL
jgi:hypothetical protein